MWIYIIIIYIYMSVSEQNDTVKFINVTEIKSFGL